MTAYAPTSACGYGCLPKPGSVPQVGWPRRVGRLLALVLVLLAGIGVAAVQPLLSPPARSGVKRAWFRRILAAAGVRLVANQSILERMVSLSGPSVPRSSQGTLVVSNHVSWLDIPAVLAVEGVRVLAKSDVRGWPLIGAMAARGGTLFIDRGSLRRLPDTVADVAGSLRAGHSVLVFPEGSTWCGRTQGRFYPAMFQSAIDAGAPVRPVSLRYRLADGTPTTVASFLGEDTLLSSVLRVVAVRGLVVELEASPVVESTATTRRALASTAAAAIRPAPATPAAGRKQHHAPDWTVHTRRR